MPRDNYLPVLEQVYDFLKERPGFKEENEFQKKVAYFSALHEGDPQEFRVQAFVNVIGAFGNKKMLDISSAPKFTDKANFLNWVDKQINY